MPVRQDYSAILTLPVNADGGKNKIPEEFVREPAPLLPIAHDLVEQVVDQDPDDVVQRGFAKGIA